MTASELLENGKTDTEEAVREGLSGHICRCTGYQGIVDAVLRGGERKPETPKCGPEESPITS